MMFVYDAANVAVPIAIRVAATVATRPTGAHGQLVVVLLVLDHVRLPQVVGEHRVEGGDVGCHTGHERGQQAGDRQPQHAVGQQVADQVQQRVVVVGRAAVVLGLGDLADEDRGDHAREDHH